MSKPSPRKKSRSVPVCKICGVRHLPIGDMESAHFNIKGKDGSGDGTGFSVTTSSPEDRIKALEERMLYLIHRLDEKDKKDAAAKQPGVIRNPPVASIPLEDKIATAIGFVEKYVADAEKALDDVKDVLQTIHAITGI